ncbi:hypothetical protein CEXT_447801 [Caerostris extrusa]|uniref:Uncharacterized protein n=1 Tax=Caerostris extrusa TaxID=172846 RepID=A0AAV4VA06_CAEEX|nr:hypothetical protein CEXT_447801 [Caerostris extrusa]
MVQVDDTPAPQKSRRGGEMSNPYARNVLSLSGKGWGKDFKQRFLPSVTAYKETKVSCWKSRKATIACLPNSSFLRLRGGFRLVLLLF